MAHSDWLWGSRYKTCIRTLCRSRKFQNIFLRPFSRVKMSRNWKSMVLNVFSNYKVSSKFLLVGPQGEEPGEDEEQPGVNGTSNQAFLFFLIFCRTPILFVGPLIPLFLTPGLPWISRSGWTSCLHALSTVCNGFLRFTSGATPTNLLAASMATKPFWFSYLCTSIGAGWSLPLPHSL